MTLLEAPIEFVVVTLFLYLFHSLQDYIIKFLLCFQRNQSFVIIGQIMTIHEKNTRVSINLYNARCPTVFKHIMYDFFFLQTTITTSIVKGGNV
jgi:hypothetical protein